MDPFAELYSQTWSETGKVKTPANRYGTDETQEES